jgi:hypothetical protein
MVMSNKTKINKNQNQELHHGATAWQSHNRRE